MISRNLLIVALLLAPALLAAAGFGYFRPQDDPGATVEEPDRTFPALAVGKKEVRFRLHNPTAHTVRVIGCPSLCGYNCCVSWKREIPFDVAPGDSVDLECILETRQPGEFKLEVRVYLDDVGLREWIMTLKGTARADAD